jgi:5'-nucleotidase
MVELFRVLLTNDDGIEAPGIRALADAFADEEGVEVWIAAPDRGRSTCSHGMSLSRPVFAHEVAPREVAVDGLPVDCVYLAMYGLMPSPPDVVISGINHGANLGSDVIFSGTVAGARQAALQGVHGMATSLVEGDDFGPAARTTCRLARELAALPATPPRVINLNFPAGAFEGPRFAPLGVREYPHVVARRTAPLTGATYYWLGGPPVHNRRIPGTDSWLIAHGVASATALALDQGDAETMQSLACRLSIIEPMKEK